MKPAERVGDYEVVSKLGSGSFGQVLLVAGKGEGKDLFALKKLSKKHILKVNKLHEPFIEKQVLFRLNELYADQPLFVHLFDTQSDEDYIYMRLEYCLGGTLEEFLQENVPSHETIRELAAKMILILEALGTHGVVHRDLKPSNFLLTKDGLLKLADFGTAAAMDEFFSKQVAAKIRDIKQISAAKERQRKEQQNDMSDSDSLGQRRSTFVGTACYMAPELLSDDFCGFEADIWAFGCILYEMIFKKSPFFDSSQCIVWKNILTAEIDLSKQTPYDVTIKRHQASLPDLKNMIGLLLRKDKGSRLGSGSNRYEDLKSHAFFKGVDWTVVSKQNIEEVVQSLKEKQLKAQKRNFKNQEKILLSGIVGKKMFFGNFKERLLILYAKPKLVYFCPDSGEKKGQIELTKTVPISLEGKIFTITTEKKTYVFKCKNAQQWIETINYAMINSYY